MTHTFTFTEHEDHGFKGWVTDLKPYFDPVDGRGVAHDVFEEMPHGGEQPHDELMALGALMFGRGSLGDAFNYQPLDEVVSREFHSLFDHRYNEEGYYLAEAPPGVRPLNRDYWGDIEDIIEGVGKHVRELIPAMIDDALSEDWQVADALAYVPDALNWMRIGYRRAHRRFFPHLDGYDVAMLFKRLADEVDRQTKFAELGDKLRVRVSYRRHDINVWHIPGYEFYHD